MITERDSWPAHAGSTLPADPAHVRAILDAALDAVVTIDHHGCILEFNRAAERTFGYLREDILGEELADLVVPPASREAHRRALERWTAAGPGPGAGGLLGRRVEVEAMRADGSVFPAELAISRVAIPGPPLFTACLRDITERKQSELALVQAEERYRTLVEHLPLAIYVDRAEQDSSNVYTSPHVESLLGYPAVQWVADRSMFDRVLHPDDRERVFDAHARAHAERGILQLEYRLQSKDGRWVWVHDEARVVDIDGESVLQGYLLDITDRKEAEEQLRHQALHDPLTGLPNSALFNDRLHHALVRRDAEPREAAVISFDLDDFKAVNDSLGHPAGDALLRAIGERLQVFLPESVTVARMGGDEFAVLVEDTGGSSAALDAADRIEEALRQPLDLDGRELYVTASLGIAVGDDADELLRRADTAMYRAKANGKAQTALYASPMDKEQSDRLDLVSDLRRADVSEEFVLHYQPLVRLANGELVGVEALLRWNHPTLGLLQPDRFIRLAEETGVIVELGRWVMQEACRQTATWRRCLPGAERLYVSVNVSTRQVRSQGLLEDVESALASSGLEPSALVLEMTESVLAHNRAEATELLEAITERGVRLALDDFGTGYSSLSLLRDLPVHYLKIDRSFIRGIEEDVSSTIFVRAIVDLAHALGLAVVAEGVESAAHVSVLRKLGCRLAQGFHFARPLSPADLDEYARNRGRSAA
ncbi:MAG TPA: EAL domain-containing protein [Gaiellaceae bacterium]|nr:EAL domain-containing protein [Gaiellaceae bacterium]